MVWDLLKALFYTKLRRVLALFFTSLLITISIASCSAGEDTASVRSLATIEAEEIVLPHADGSTLSRIMERGTVRVAVPDDFPPFGAVNATMQLQGYDIDVANEMAKGLGVELQLVPVVGNYRIPFLQTDRADMVISSLGKNADREVIIDFSEPYAPFFSGVYGGPDIQVSSLEELNGQTIGVSQGSLEDLEISKLPAGTVEVKRFASNSLTASALVSGQVELIATGNVVAAKLIRDNPDQQIESKFIMKDSPCYVGVRKGDTEFLTEINTIIADLKQSGRLNEISVQWFGEPLPTSLAS
ncbi:transporter substrate-binding domain-containing protein [Leptolyngbya sp. FACHB-671]|uniref:transporter substrate-binding domain-containing protein n=1 Tax=Leptolyngbya sp. FACHB-671 TaxID=2692812 RepID=UPI001685D7E9|nr:transporter substrate-binding domain-containing protein [Leptolyngbya sp. FACHB-671]MBD2071333.1 transporter substrate-binding domain-containing protein [Leptolyngbya sp. FACHB-671]